MPSYLERIEQTPATERWPLVRRWMDSEPLLLYKELREFRPVLELPQLTIVTRFSDCTGILRQHDTFSVRLYQDKQGDFWMAQDDTAPHWREKGIMRSVLNLEELPDIRRFVGEKARSLLQQANGSVDSVNGLSRAVPIALGTGAVWLRGGRSQGTLRVVLLESVRRFPQPAIRFRCCQGS